MAKLEQLLQRGEKIRRTAGVHPAGLAAALLTRAFQLLALYVVTTAVGKPWLAWIDGIEGARELGLIALLAPIPVWVTRVATWLLVVVVLLAGFDFLRWRATRFVLTDRRVLQSYGVLSRLVVDTPLDTIAEMALRQHLVAEQLDYGDLLLRTGALDGCRPMEYIAGPVAFRNAVERARIAIVASVRSERWAEPAATTTRDPLEAA